MITTPRTAHGGAALSIGLQSFFKLEHQFLQACGFLVRLNVLFTVAIKGPFEMRILTL